MTEVSGVLRASFPHGPEGPLFISAVNALSDQSWRQFSSQLPRKGVKSVGALDASAAELYAEHLPAFNSLFPGVAVLAADLELLASCGSAVSSHGFELQCTHTSQEHLVLIAQLLRRLGAPAVEGIVAHGGNVERMAW